MVDAVEIAEFGDDLAAGGVGGGDDHNFVGLIGRRPDVVVAIEPQAVTAVDAVCKHLR